MKITNNLQTRILCRTLALVLANAAIPFGIPKMIIDAWPKSAPKPAKKAVKPSRPLTAKQMKTMNGKCGENPYLAGQAKWDPMFKGVDLLTGNYSMSVTDLDFEGGYGIPVNVTRSYSSNQYDDGPFGKGWTLSADVRSTAGGLLKGPSAPVRAVPTNIAEQPPTEYDPNAQAGNGARGEGTGSALTVPSTPVQAVVSTDAGGTAETIQKDVDGILTTPPWDNNVQNATYEFVTFGGNVYQILIGNTTTTIDGTSYVYTKEGSYGSGGQLPYNADELATPPTATPANVLKVTSATDRQGNVTNYAYGSGTVTFYKSDGTTTESPLTSVTMPSGHVITFVWTGNRVTSIHDNGSARTVSYGYDDSGDLTSVTTPGGKTTTYGYGSAYVPSSWTSEGLDVAGAMLTTITDPRGLVTTISYMMAMPALEPYGVELPGVVVMEVDDPNGMKTLFQLGPNYLPTSIYGSYAFAGGGFSASDGQTAFAQFASGNMVNSGTLLTSLNTSVSSNPVLTVTMNDAVSVYGQTGQRWQKSYNVPNQTLTVDDETTVPYAYGGSSSPQNPHGLYGPSWSQQDVVTTKSYNFMGNPLSSAVQEFQTVSGTQTQTRSTAETDYAYWDSTKYYQQKATKDQAGRYTYTDYYPNTASAGSLGQTYEVFDNAHAGFYMNTSVSLPSYATSGTDWIWQLTPTSGDYSAKFVYDSVGRATDVYKLQNTSGTWAYVQTHTTYGTLTDGSWGEAASVVEDYGGIGRTTTTNGYTADGKADDVTDAAGHEFVTSYDGDGVVQSVTRTDGTSTTLVSYTYGSSGLTTGMPLTITDGLSGVVQTLTYASSGGGIGQVATVTEANGSDSYESLYSYDSQGNRATVEYSTPSATNYWRYDDYDRVGTPDNPKWAFFTLTKSDSSWDKSAEAMHYLYDSQGRLEDAAFAQSPVSGYTPTGSNPWYDSSHPASTRARAFYTYDAAGRVLSVDHWWDTWGGSSYSSSYLVGNSCAYETSGSYNRGLKTGDTFLTDSSGSPATAWTQSYGYDANFDYLTSAYYGDSQPNATQSWTYDAAGNRTSDYTGSSWAYDHLNRMTSNGAGTSYSNDILGNRTAIGSGLGAGSYTWDSLNRMTASVNSGASPAHLSYSYRADGMRVEKILHSGIYTEGGEIDDQYSRYRYDGQMPMETFVTKADSSTVLTENGLGARGLDYVSLTTTPSGGSPTTSVVFPIYDAHGNEVATLARSGSSYSLSNQRSYGAWGEIRQGATTGGPRGRYCGDLGHVQDDETGLIYMRARYYDPGVGRFISQDNSAQGWNWFSYCGNCPISATDDSGRAWWFLIGSAFVAFAMGFILATGFKLAFHGSIEFSAEDWCNLIAGSLLAGLAATAKLNSKADSLAESIVKRIMGPTLTELNSPEAAAAENSDAGLAFDACAFEVSEDETEMAEDELDQDLG